MASRGNNKLLKRQQKELSKYVAKFNAKLTREKRANPALSLFLPDKLDVKQLKQTLTTKDLNRLKKEIDRAFKPNALKPIMTESGVKTTQWELTNIKQRVAFINREREKELKRANISTEKGTMGSIKGNNLLPKQFDLERIRGEEWAKYVESVEKQSAFLYLSEQQERLKENYLKAVENQLGEFGEDLYNFVKALPLSIFMDGYYSDALLELDYVYTKEQAESIAEIALDSWRDFLDE